MTGVVFDFGGVLFNWRPAALLARVLPGRVHDEASAAEWVTRFFQGYGGDWGEFDRGTVEVDELVQRIAHRTGLSAAEVLAVVHAVPLELQPVPETVALLEALRAAGHEMFFLSNMPRVYAQHLVQTHSVVSRFRDGIFSSSVGLIKPEPQIFELAAHRFGKPVRELVFLDDTQVNIDVARKLGWQALHFSSAAQTSNELRALGLLR